MKTKNVKRSEEAIKGAENYFAAHPGSPSALRRPKLRIRSGTCFATLGWTFERIVGVGMTVEGAFRSFDAQYLAALRPRAKGEPHCIKSVCRRLETNHPCCHSFK